MALTATHSTFQISRSIVLESLLMGSLLPRERLVPNEACLGLLGAVVGATLNEAILINLLISGLVATL